MRKEILDFIAANPGTKNGHICAHLKRPPCDRLVDQCMQRMRRAGDIVFRKGWFIVEKRGAELP